MCYFSRNSGKNGPSDIINYFKRQYTIEPIFGHLKYNLGYKSFLLRGVEKVGAEFRLMCIGWNLKKMLKMGIRSVRV